MFKKICLSTLFMIMYGLVIGQVTHSRNLYLKLSGGSVSFGSGDIPGYSLSFDVSKDLVKRSVFGFHKFLIGGELIFESGVKKVVVENPTLGQFLNSFHQVSNTIIWAKVSYHPFNKIISGFNIHVGPTAGYSQRSGEKSAMRTIDILGQATRWSTLYFDNGFTYGYRISTGYEFQITQSFLAGIRIDFSNNQEAEINTLAAVKLGVKL